MTGKPIHCDAPAANMTRFSYARVLIEVDLLLDLLTTVNVVLPNGTSLSQQSYEAPTCSGNSSPSVETAAVKKQQPYSVVPLADPLVNPMFTEADINGETRPKSPGRKRTKIVETGHSGSRQSTTPKVVHISEEGDDAAVEPPKMQYLTRSRTIVTISLGKQEKQKSKAPTVTPGPLSSFADTAPSSTF
uniref:Uncharacterized protein n=1 Tax=Populus alba TaxID=43335 RepID=A0A4U5PTT4_POPAL|nr:hypothetical protein D5086_0000185940 [Populus alba]